MSPETYNQMMISILYRLTHLSFENDASQEAIRVALLNFCATLFLTRCYFDQPYERLSELYNATLVNCCQVSSEPFPKPIMFWLVMLYHVVTGEPTSSGTVRFDKEFSPAQVDTWEEAHAILRSIMWIDFVHGNRGREIFETVVRETITRNSLEMKE